LDATEVLDQAELTVGVGAGDELGIDGRLLADEPTGNLDQAGCRWRRPGCALHRHLRLNQRLWTVVVPSLAWGGGFGAALLIGAVAELLPALRAARMSPTEALWTV
jgi:hypothetical protein